MFCADDNIIFFLAIKSVHGGSKGVGLGGLNPIRGCFFACQYEHFHGVAFWRTRVPPPRIPTLTPLILEEFVALPLLTATINHSIMHFNSSRKV